jgi:hypothetical protein
MRRAVLASFAAGLVAFTALAAVPWVTKKRDFPASITSPPPRLTVALAELPGREQMCMRDVTIEPRSQLARFKVGTYGKAGPPLILAITGQGYRASGRVQGGYPDNQLLQVPVRPPARPQLVRVCLRNLGSGKIAFYAAQGAEASRAEAVVAGRPLGVTPQFGFWEASRHSLAGHASLTIRRMALLRGPFDHAWRVWVVLALALLALTLGVGAAAWTGTQSLLRRSPDEPSAPGADSGSSAAVSPSERA